MDQVAGNCFSRRIIFDVALVGFRGLSRHHLLLFVAILNGFAVGSFGSIDRSIMGGRGLNSARFPFHRVRFPFLFHFPKFSIEFFCSEFLTEKYFCLLTVKTAHFRFVTCPKIRAGTNRIPISFSFFPFFRPKIEKPLTGSRPCVFWVEDRTKCDKASCFFFDFGMLFPDQFDCHAFSPSEYE